MSESLLEKYPHLKLLTKMKKPPVIPLPDAAADQNKYVPDTKNDLAASAGRISLLGPGVGSKKPLVPLQPPPAADHSVPRTKVFAEDLFAASVAADDDQWLQFQVEDTVAAKQQLDELKMWLMANRPSIVTRSSGVGWIAVKFKDKGKKVLEAKAAWDSHEGEKSMEVVNNLAEEFSVKGGKWLCHLPTSLIDQVWDKMATTLMCGGLGPSVYMVKVSPRQDIHPEQSRGEHVICVYNTDYKDTEQVMRVENLMRSAGVTTILNYKPDIFSALGIYRNNKWGFRPTIYKSCVLTMEGKSRVETVGTNKWYFNSSKGLQYPPERKAVSIRDLYIRTRGVGVGKENLYKVVPLREEVKLNEMDKSMSDREMSDKFVMERIEDLKSVDMVKEKKVTKTLPSNAQLQFQSLDEMKNLVPAVANDHSEREEIKNAVFDMVDMEDMKISTKLGRGDLSPDPLAGCKQVTKSMSKEKLVADDVTRLEVAGNMSVSTVVERSTELKIDNLRRPVEKMMKSNQASIASPKIKKEKQKPAWLLKLEQLQLKSLDQMSKIN